MSGAEKLDDADIGAKQTSEPQPSPAPPAMPSSPAPAVKSDDLEAIRSAVVDAAGVSAGLWLSYLFVLFYLLVAAGGVTHRDLFLANSVKLPFLNVDLPLEGFFWLGPALFLIVHGYVLLHFVLLSSKAGMFDAQLRTQIGDPKVRAELRRQLPINIFVQFLAGPREVRRGLIGFLLRLIAWISLVFGPVALLVFFELQFLPYHAVWITMWQRTAVVIDLVLLWLLWPAVLHGEATRRGWRRVGWVTGAMLACISLISILLVFAIATFPGEWLEAKLAGFPLRQTLVAGDVDPVGRKTTSLWSNRLVLPGFDVIDHTIFDTEAKIAAAPAMARLRGRNLEGVVLVGAVLRKVDFAGADLTGALLDDADLRDAELCSSTFRELGSTLAIKAMMMTPSSSFVGQTAICARLSGASLDDAQLQGASLVGAQLQGASLADAQLQGASLADAQLQGASLEGANLQGASLDDAQLQGTSLDRAQLQGASLADAQLQGASLDHAQLQGALFDDTQLQGASFVGAQLQGATLYGVFVWRADVRKAFAQGAVVDSVTIDPQQCGFQGCDWGKFLNSLKPLLNRTIRPKVEPRLDRLDPAKPVPAEEQMAQRWSELESASLNEKQWAEIWRKIGCAEFGAPFVLDGLVRNISMGYLPPGFGPEQVGNLATEFLKEDCAGARGIAANTRKELIKLAHALRREAMPQ